MIYPKKPITDMSRTELKLFVQDEIMYHLSTIGYSIENSSLSEEEADLFRAEITRQGDRIAKLMGYEGFWFS